MVFLQNYPDFLEKAVYTTPKNVFLINSGLSATFYTVSDLFIIHLHFLFCKQGNCLVKHSYKRHNYTIPILNVNKERRGEAVGRARLGLVKIDYFVITLTLRLTL